MKIKVKCPAKINLTLKVFKKDETTEFHPIESIMQSVSLFDYLTIEKNNSKEIIFNGNSKEISYDENNLVIKAMNAFFLKTGIKEEGLNIYLEKNIPIAAGLAGGSTDCAGMVLALNNLYNFPLNKNEIFEINKSLGSDINFCYTGGKALCKGKGDDIQKLPFEKFELSLIKPINLKISTKVAYGEFDKLTEESTMLNDLEFAMTKIHPEFKKLSMLGFQMSGSGPSFFIKNKNIPKNYDYSNFLVYENLYSYDKGVEII